MIPSADVLLRLIYFLKRCQIYRRVIVFIIADQRKGREFSDFSAIFIAMLWCWTRWAAGLAKICG